MGEMMMDGCNSAEHNDPVQRSQAGLSASNALETTLGDAGNELTRIGGHTAVVFLLAIASQFDPLHAAMAAPAATVFVDKVVGNYGQRRRDKWFQQLSDSVTLLIERVGGLETSQKLMARFQDEEFVTVVQEATRIALATHEEEKVGALRNVVLHTALEDIDMAEELRLRFTKKLDGYGPTHFDILSFAVLPSAWIHRKGLSLPTWDRDYDPGKLIEKQLKASPMYSLAISDLLADGFLEKDPYFSVHNRHFPDTFHQNHAQPLGTLFYRFINNPESLKEALPSDKEKSPDPL